MEAAALGEDGRTEEAAGEGREGLSLGFGYYASPRLHHQQHHRIIRSDAFRVASSCHAAAGASTASDGRAGPPPSPRTLASLPSSGVGGGGGGTAALGHGGISDFDSYGTPRAVRPVNSPGLAGDATLQLCSFTAAQWQELHRQALIFKCIVTSTPVPTDLLLTHSRFPDGHPFFSNLTRGGDYLNLRFTGANGDLEPGRCRRTDGKKWRCSRDVAPGQKYCERHVHRARPRSRKPVEVVDGRGADPAAAAANNAAETVSSTSSGAKDHGAPSTSTAKPAAARPSAQSPPGLPASGGDVKFPFQFMVPEDKKLRYLGSYGGVHAEAQPATQQWQRPHSMTGLQQHNGDNRLNLRCSSLNDHHGCRPFPSTLISALDTDPHHRRDTQRCFIDAWSRSENPFDGVTIGDGYKTNSGDGASSCVRSNLSPSSLTLSMSGTGDGGGEHVHDHVQMGMRATDSGKMLGPSWMSPVSPIGGPLAEVLQTSSTVSFRNECAGHENDGAARGGSGGLIDLMCKTSCDSEGTSPRRGFSSPTRVLQKALVSLSDSSSNSNSSTTFGPGRRPELGLQWGSPFN